MRVIDLKSFGGEPEQLQSLLERQHALRMNLPTKPTRRPSKSPLPKHRQGEKFIRGPIPFDWLQAALAIGGKAGNLAWAISYRAGIEQQNPIKLTGQTLREFQIAPCTARRLLHDFEQAGLVEVDRKRGRGPIVFLQTLNNLTPIDQQPEAEIH